MNEDVLELAPASDGVELDGQEIRDRVTGGVAAVGLRAMGVRFAGLIANVVLARLLVPKDFGVLAVGQTLVMFGSLVTDVGFGAGLMRQRKKPSQEQLDALFGLQLTLTSLFTAVLVVGLLPFGEIGHVTAVMTSSLILASLAGPRIVMLERRLEYSVIAAADVASGMAYAVLAIALVVCGLGVWGVAIAHVIRAGMQSAIIYVKTREQRIVPRLSLSPLRGLVRFGMTFQAATLLDLARSEGLNLLTLAIAGESVLGIWSLAQRILLIPYLLFEALWRVSYPAIARMAEKGIDPRHDVDRALQLAMAVTVCMLIGVSASAPVLIPSVFGTEWTGVASIVPLASLGISLVGPISAAYGGYLFAMGRADRVLAATAAAAVSWFVALPLLLPREGPSAFGIVWLIASVAEASFLAFALGIEAARNCVRHIWAPLAIGSLVAGATLWLSRAEQPHLVEGIGLALAATTGYVAIMCVVRRRLVADIFRLGSRMLSKWPRRRAEGRSIRRPPITMTVQSVPSLELTGSDGASRGGWRLVLVVVAIAVIGASSGGAGLMQYLEPLLLIGIAAWLIAQKRATDYAEFVLILWFVSPELRRYVDYRSAYHAKSAILIAPYLAALLGPLSPKGWVKPTGLFIREFTYLSVVVVLNAAVVALALETSKTAILADLLTWLPPVSFGVFLLSGAVNRTGFEAMISRVAPWLLLVFAAYGIVQWIVAPAWDGAWLSNIGTAGQSFGVASPFDLRIWGFANSPGTYAAFLGWLLIVVLGRLPPNGRKQRRFRTAALLVGSVALGVTGVRAAWIAVIVGVIVLLWYGHIRPVRLITALATLALVIGVVPPLRLLVTTRIASTAQGSSGQSANARLAFQSAALPAALRNPVGEGLGSAGAGVRAGAAQSNDPYANTDSGYVQVLREFGSVPGGALLALLILICVASVLDGYSQDQDGGTWSALNAAVPVSLIFGTTWDVTLFVALAAAAMGRHQLLSGRSKAVAGGWVANGSATELAPDALGGCPHEHDVETGRSVVAGPIYTPTAGGAHSEGGARPSQRAVRVPPLRLAGSLDGNSSRWRGVLSGAGSRLPRNGTTTRSPTLRSLRPPLVGTRRGATRRVTLVSREGEVSGAERSLLDLASGLRALFDVSMVCPVPSTLSQLARKRGLSVGALPTTAVSREWGASSVGRLTGGAFREVCVGAVAGLRLRPCIVHANSPRAALVGIPMSFLGRSKLVIHVRDVPRRSRLADLYLRFVLHMADAVICDSKFVEDGVRRAGATERLTTIFNSVDPSRFAPGSDKAVAVRRWLGCQDDAYLLAVVGQISPWKGQLEAIKAVELARQRGSEAVLLVVGSAKFLSDSSQFDNAAYEAELRRYVIENGLESVVYFLPETEEVPTLMRELDVLLVPSWCESFGRVVIEGMSSGLPVVATAVGGPAEIISDGINGLLREPENIDAWADAILALERSEIDVAMLSKLARERAQEFALERHLDAVARLYEDVLTEVL